LHVQELLHSPSLAARSSKPGRRSNRQMRKPGPSARPGTS
jgi:hypothetical protein